MQVTPCSLSSPVLAMTCRRLLLLWITIIIVFIYKNAGIFVGNNKVVHFTPKKEENSRTQFFKIGISSISNITAYCPASQQDCEINCGFRRPNSGVVLSCLSCFLGNCALYCFEYGVSKSHFLTRVRGGTCTIAASDPPQIVVHRAMYLLKNGYGNFDVFQNNCEDFALYCKTGLLTRLKGDGGSSGQATSFIGGSLAIFCGSAVRYFIAASPVGVGTVTAGTYSMSRYYNDIGVRYDVTKVDVKDVAMKLGKLDGNMASD